MNTRRGRGPLTAEMVAPTTGWNLEIEYFLDCVQQGRSPKLCMPETSIASLKIAEAESKAALTGKTVKP